MEIEIPLLPEHITNPGFDAELLKDIPLMCSYLEKLLETRCTWWTDGRDGILRSFCFARVDEEPLVVDRKTLWYLRERAADLLGCPAQQLGVRLIG